jgi:enoyl-CoA hydratase/carnithine racemase
MADYSRYQYIKVGKEDKIATVTLNRPEARNAIMTEMHFELEDVFSPCRSPAVVAVVVRCVLS